MDTHSCTSNDPYCFPEGIARLSFYGVGGVPDVRTDGKNPTIGASSCASAYNTYRTKYLARMTETGGIAPVSIEGVWSISGSTATVDVTITLLDPVALGTVQASVFISEDDVYYDSQRTFNALTRAIRHESVTTLVNPGDQYSFQKSIPVGESWEEPNLHCIAILQKTTGDKAVWQAGSIPYLVDFSVQIPERVASVPNGNGDAYFYGTIRNDTASLDVLTLSFDESFGWPTAFQVEGDPTWYTDPTAFDFAGSEGKDVILRVTTDGLRSKRIGSGMFRVESQNTGRTSSTGLRVFNGSYSVLFVDDDGTRTDEAPWIAGLDAEGYLYENWQVSGAHGGMSPTLGDMAGFDVVLWQHGFLTSNLLSSADTTNLKAYLDLGGALLLNSMDYMNSQSQPPTPFLRDYLGVESWQTAVGASVAEGLPGDPISDGLNVPLTWPSPSSDRVDMLVPVAGGETYFLNDNAQSVAVRREFGNSRVCFNTIAHNAFPTNDPDPNNARTVLARQIQWLAGASGTESVDDAEASLPGRLQAYPNPFLGSTEISFALTPRGAASGATLTVVDPAGRQVRALTSGPLRSGAHRLAWDGRDDQGRVLPSGIYFVRLESADGKGSRKLVLTR